MAATTAPLVWSFYRAVASGADGPGGLAHYFDESSQSLYLDGTIQSRAADVPDGHWRDAVQGAVTAIGTDAYSALRLSHPCNGTLHGVAVSGSDLYYLRYLYAMDISDFCSGTWKARRDNLIKQISLSVDNVGADVFSAEHSLFNPGGRLTLAVASGDSEIYDVGVAYIDDVDYDAWSATIPVSGRSTAGFKLSTQTMDELTSITGTADVVAAQILARAGITDYHVQPADHTWTHTFKPNQSCLSALQQLCAFYTESAVAWDILEAPDGSIVVGYASWRAQYQANGVYTFDGRTEVRKRKTKKAADAAYTRLCVTGKDAGGAALTPVYAEVTPFAYWYLGAHKTLHVTAPDGYTQDQLAAYAANYASALQYVGIGEEFDGPLRPQLLCGDVACVYCDDSGAGVDLGIITDITHSWGDKGFWTQFSVDSGGVVTDGESYVITSNRPLQGYNRRQTLADLIGVIAGK